MSNRIKKVHGKDLRSKRDTKINNRGTTQLSDTSYTAMYSWKKMGQSPSKDHLQEKSCMRKVTKLQKKPMWVFDGE